MLIGEIINIVMSIICG